MIRIDSRSSRRGISGCSCRGVGRCGGEVRIRTTLDRAGRPSPGRVHSTPSFWRSLVGLTKTSPPDGARRRAQPTTGRSCACGTSWRSTCPRRRPGSSIPTTSRGSRRPRWDLASPSRRGERSCPSRPPRCCGPRPPSTLLTDGDDTVRRGHGVSSRSASRSLGGRVENVIVYGIGDHLGEEADAVPRHRLG